MSPEEGRYSLDHILQYAPKELIGRDAEKARISDAWAKALRADTWESPLSLGGKVAFAPGGQNIKAESIITQLQGGEYKRIFPEGLADTKMIFPMKPWNQR